MTIISQQQCPELAGSDYFKGCVINYDSLAAWDISSGWKAQGPAQNMINRLGAHLFFKIINGNYDEVLLTAESESQDGATYQFFNNEKDKEKKELGSTISAIIKRQEKFIFALSHASNNMGKVGSITIRAKSLENDLTEEIGTLCFQVITMGPCWLSNPSGSVQFKKFRGKFYNNLHFEKKDPISLQIEDTVPEATLPRNSSPVRARLLSENYFSGCAFSLLRRKKSDFMEKIRGPAIEMQNIVVGREVFKFSNLDHDQVNLEVECDPNSSFAFCEGLYTSASKKLFKKLVFKIRKGCEEFFILMKGIDGEVSQIKLTTVAIGFPNRKLGELKFDVEKRERLSIEDSVTVCCINETWYNNFRSPVITREESENFERADIPEPRIPENRTFWQVI